MKTQISHNLSPGAFDSETAYKVANKVIWNFFSGVSSKYIKTLEIPDIVQEAVIRAYTYSYSYNPSMGKFSGWVGMTAWRYAYDFLMRRKKELADIEITYGDWEKVEFSNPERELVNQEQAEAIAKFKRSLSAADSECLEYMEDGLRPRHIAKEMNCSAGAAAARTCRIRKLVEQQKF